MGEELRPPSSEGDRLIRVLRRWEESGGSWQVADRTAGAVTVLLLRCDGGEVADRLTSSDPTWCRYLQQRGPGRPES